MMTAAAAAAAGDCCLWSLRYLAGSGGTRLEAATDLTLLDCTAALCCLSRALPVAFAALQLPPTRYYLVLGRGTGRSVG